MSNISYERRKAVAEAWKNEKGLVLNGKGTRDWSQKEQCELLSLGRVKGYQGHHMKSVDGHNSKAGDSSNIQFLTRSEHLEAHKGNYHNNTNGYYDASNRIMHDFGRNRAHIEARNLSKPLSKSQKNAILSELNKSSIRMKLDTAKEKAKSMESRNVKKTKSTSLNSSHFKDNLKSKTLSQQRLSKPSEASNAVTKSKTLTSQRSNPTYGASLGVKSMSSGETLSSGQGSSKGSNNKSGKGTTQSH